jgi:hypothetical protein
MIKEEWYLEAIQALKKIQELVKVDDWGGWTDADGILESISEIVDEVVGEE